ncbi:MAG: BspA family leucine-rich repeat surface protein [Oscillospiraceae bacterium]|nr:BspA family leucine-rich repeat surface protein [Oscillospiraceae bacterium]
MAKLCLGCMQQKNSSPVCEHCGYHEEMQNQPHQLPVGTLLQGKYLVGRVLGQGGFGITYLGWDQHLSVPVAIKEYYPVGVVQRNNKWGNEVICASGEAPEIFEKHKEKFLQEARVLAQFAGIPEIVQVLNYFSENGTAYIVMEYVQGITLKIRLKQMGRPMTEAEVRDIIAPVLEALDKVHKQNLIHRDISPDNIMLPDEGGVKLIDFGTVRYVGEGGATRSTEAVLKPGFAPIEQYNAKGNLGSWTDVYAICATCHYLLTGKVLPDATTRIENGETLPFLEGNPNISPELLNTLRKGLAIRAADRVQTLSELTQMLRGDAGVTENPEKKPEKPGKKKGKAPVWIAAGCAAVAAVLAMGLMTGKTAPGQPEQTVPQLQQETIPVTQAPETEPTAAPQETEPSESPALWKNNVLRYDDDEGHDSFMYARVFGTNIYRSHVATVTFLDYVPQVDAQTYDVSENRDGSVLMWVEGSSPNYDLYFAADGGINAQGKACRSLFAGYSNMHSVTFNGALHTDYAIDMFSMFYNCKKLNRLDLSTLNTGMVRDMGHMFVMCFKLQSVDLSGWDTSRVTTMAWMFDGCLELAALDLSSFNTSSVTDMSEMFQHCTMLQQLDVSNFDTSSVLTMDSMFRNCQSLIVLDLSMFDTGIVNSFNSMFNGCAALKQLNLSGWNTVWLEDMGEMFSGCKSLRALDLSHFDTSRVTDMRGLFAGCTSLNDLVLGNWETGSVSEVYDFYPRTVLPDGRTWTELFWNS